MKVPKNIAGYTLLGPDGEPADLHKIKGLLDTRPDPWIISEYRNEKFYVCLSTLKKTRTHDIPKELWTRYRLTVERIVKSDGKTEFMFDRSTSFCTKLFAEASYEAFLIDYTECVTDENGDLIERGNLLNAPQLEGAKNPESFGSW